MVHLRVASESDAAKLIALRRRLYEETNFLLWEPAEFKVTEVDEAKRIQRVTASGNSAIFVVEEAGELVGLASAFGGERNRNRHAATLALGLLRSHWSRGIAMQMMRALIEWAPAVGVTRLDLNVSTANLRAIALYLRCGFQIEGRKRASLLVDGQYVDDYEMALVRI